MSFGVFDVAKDIAIEGLKSASTESPDSSPHSSVLDAVSSKSPTPKSRKVNVTVTEKDVKPPAPKTGLYKFINSSNPRDLKAQEHRKLVRSQAARLLPLEGSGDGATKPKKRRRHQRLAKNVTFHIDLRVNHSCERTGKSSEDVTESLDNSTEARWSTIPLGPDGGWPAPFAQLPSKSHAFAPGLMHHYLTVLAIDIPELDLFQPGLLRSSWFPMALTEPACFQVILLTAASHYAMINNMQRAAQLIALRQDSLHLINQLLYNNNDACNDGAIAAVAKMASWEAQFGNKNHYEIHMEGLKQMLKLRGGIDKLGLDGLLMRMVLWIDINAHHIVRTPLYFATHATEQGTPLPLPNPEMYIGAS